MDDIIEYFAESDSDIIVGIGNMVGWGESFLEKLGTFKVKSD